MNKFRMGWVFRRGLVIVLGLAVLMMLLGARRGTPRRFEATEFHMDTAISITVYANDEAEANRLFRKAFDEIARIQTVLEPLKGNGYLKKVNAAPSGVWHEMNPDIRMVLLASKRYYTLSGGVFDPTIGPVKWLWDFEDGGRIPDRDELKRTLGVVGLDKVEIRGNRFRFTVPGMKLDFGAIAKGYAVDRMAEVLRKNGAKAAIINAGGNIITVGRKPDNSNWIIGVRHPRKAETVLVDPVPNIAVATSGDYERYFIRNGMRYHHLLDPGTGYPSRKCVAVTIWTKDAMDADALSTTLFLLGPRDGVAFAKKLKAEALFYSEEDGRLEMAMTPGIAGRVKP